MRRCGDDKKEEIGCKARIDENADVIADLPEAPIVKRTQEERDARRTTIALYGCNRCAEAMPVQGSCDQLIGRPALQVAYMYEARLKEANRVVIASSKTRPIEWAPCWWV